MKPPSRRTGHHVTKVFGTIFTYKRAHYWPCSTTTTTILEPHTLRKMYVDGHLKWTQNSVINGRVHPAHMAPNVCLKWNSTAIWNWPDFPFRMAFHVHFLAANVHFKLPLTVFWNSCAHLLQTDVFSRFKYPCTSVNFGRRPIGLLRRRQKFF